MVDAVIRHLNILRKRCKPSLIRLTGSRKAGRDDLIRSIPKKVKNGSIVKGKRGGGIVGITRTTAASCRSTLPYNLRAHIAALTRKMYHVDADDQIICNESNPLRKLRDNADERKVIELLRQANVFNVNEQTTVLERLQNMVTKDVATTQIEESLLKANSLGHAGYLCK